jgi:hypothetical protein
VDAVEQYMISQIKVGKQWKDIARELGCSKTGLKCACMWLGTSFRDLKTRLRKDYVLPKGAIDFLEGELLGDGHLNRTGKRNACYVHTSEHREYIEYLQKMFSEWEIEYHDIQSRLHTKSYTPGKTTYAMNTVTYPFLGKMQNRWYPLGAGSKRVPKDIVLAPVTCRQWYIGDGALCTDTKSSRSSTIILCTDRYPLGDVEFLAQKLREIGIKTTTFLLRDKFYRLKLSATQAWYFLEYIGPCPAKIIEIYGYKWSFKASKRLIKMVSAKT